MLRLYLRYWSTKIFKYNWMWIYGKNIWLSYKTNEHKHAYCCDDISAARMWNHYITILWYCLLVVMVSHVIALGLTHTHGWTNTWYGSCSWIIEIHTNLPISSYIQWIQLTAISSSRMQRECHFSAMWKLTQNLAINLFRTTELHLQSSTWERGHEHNWIYVFVSTGMISDTTSDCMTHYLKLKTRNRQIQNSLLKRKSSGFRSEWKLVSTGVVP